MQSLCTHHTTLHHTSVLAWSTGWLLTIIHMRCCSRQWCWQEPSHFYITVSSDLLNAFPGDSCNPMSAWRPYPFFSPCRTRKGHLTQSDLAEGLRFASPMAFNALSTSGSLESELAEEFAAMDANGDGKISFEEFKTALSGAREGSPPVQVAAH